MKKRRKLKEKLFRVYLLFVLVISVLLGGSFFLWSFWNYSEDAKYSIQELADRVSFQLDSYIKEMDKLTIELLSSKEIIQILNERYLLDREGVEKDNFEKMELSRMLQERVLIKGISRTDIYQCIIFDRYGNISSSIPLEMDISENRKKISAIPWVDRVKEMEGRKLLLSPHMDDWNGREEVFSVTRLMRDIVNELAYVEVQQSVKVLEDLCKVESRTGIMEVFVLDENGDVIYPGKGKINLEEVINNKKKGNTGYIEASHTSDYSGWTICIRQDRKNLMRPLKINLAMMMSINVMVVLISLIMFKLVIRRMTQPLESLRCSLDKITYEDTTSELELFDSERDEVKALGVAFQKMRRRLDMAVKNEISARTLQIQANYNALQSQINPHFIYNVLSVISCMGDDAGQPQISAVCQNLSKMLRYTSSHNNESVTFRQEIEYIRSYIALMKCRYEERLEYEIEIQDELLTINVPKLVLQPMIENAFKYGFAREAPVLVITLRGFVTDYGWQMIIMDNGNGFTEEKLKELQQKIQKKEMEILEEGKNSQLAFGGLGVVNTYLRMRLFYGKNFTMRLANLPQGGAKIVFLYQTDNADQNVWEEE